MKLPFGMVSPWTRFAILIAMLFAIGVICYFARVVGLLLYVIILIYIYFLQYRFQSRLARDFMDPRNRGSYQPPPKPPPAFVKCATCGFDRAGIDAAAICPECGTFPPLPRG